MRGGIKNGLTPEPRLFGCLSLILDGAKVKMLFESAKLMTHEPDISVIKFC